MCCPVVLRLLVLKVPELHPSSGHMLIHCLIHLGLVRVSILQAIYLENDDVSLETNPHNLRFHVDAALPY